MTFYFFFPVYSSEIWDESACDFDNCLNIKRCHSSTEVPELLNKDKKDEETKDDEIDNAASNNNNHHRKIAHARKHKKPDSQEQSPQRPTPTEVQYMNN